jgi:cytochrome P450 family 6
MSFTLYLLAKNPECQERVRREIKEVKAKHGDITYQALKEMTYLDCCLKGKS